MSSRVLTGDCRAMLATLPAESVQMVCTSPPYYGLRDYGTAIWEGGDPACDHVAGMARQDTGRETPGGRGGSFRGGTIQFRGTCGKCGAVRIDNQIGMEQTPDDYVAAMVEVFRGVKRVLRNDGTCWLNLGDSYAGGKTGRADDDTLPRPRGGHREGAMPGYAKQRPVPSGYKPKDLLGIPWRVAFALQADGWWLRSAIVWHKPNPMPESIRDRPTSSYEMVFMLAKAERYFYDAEAVKEPLSETTHGWTPKAVAPSNDKYSSLGSGHSGKRAAPNLDGRNARNVWTIATQPYSGAHFATMPPELAERCILAGTSEKGCCGKCGAPWGRVTETERYATRPGNAIKADTSRNDGGRADRVMSVATTTGWAPSCTCNADVVPCVVLDPFAGAGTTLLVADRLQRDAVGIELNPTYSAMARDRVTADAPLFAEVAD